MIITMQTIEERLPGATRLIGELGEGIIHIDKRKRGCLLAFLDMLDYEVDDYRVHLQDDIDMVDGLAGYLPILIQYLQEYEIDLCGLFVPATAWLGKGKTVHRLDNKVTAIAKYNTGVYFPMQAAIFSKQLVDIMRGERDVKGRGYWDYVRTGGRKLNDDEFLAYVIRRYNIDAYLHIPSLVQHLEPNTSTTGTPTGFPGRVSMTFFKDLLTNKGDKQ